jgi:hypothetical protein
MQAIIENVIRSKSLRPVHRINFTGSLCKIEFSDGFLVQQNVSPSLLLEISLWLSHDLTLALYNPLPLSDYINGRRGYKVCVTTSAQQWQDLALLGARSGDTVIVNNELLLMLST